MNTNDANLSEILTFLARAKKLMADNKYDFVPRRKNMQALAAHGLSINDVKSEIIELVAADYYRGSKEDFDASRPGDIWEFKKNVDGQIFYVKLKIQNQNGEDILKCLSFHEDDFA